MLPWLHQCTAFKFCLAVPVCFHGAMVCVRSDGSCAPRSTDLFFAILATRSCVATGCVRSVFAVLRLVWALRYRSVFLVRRLVCGAFVLCDAAIFALLAVPPVLRYDGFRRVEIFFDAFYCMFLRYPHRYPIIVSPCLDSIACQSNNLEHSE